MGKTQVVSGFRFPPELIRRLRERAERERRTLRAEVQFILERALDEDPADELAEERQAVTA